MADNRNVVNRFVSQTATYYRFGDPDPDLSFVCDEIIRSGLGVGEILERVLDASGGSVHLSYATVHNWLSGRTKRPQNFTMTWVGRALGLERKWVGARSRNRR